MELKRKRKDNFKRRAKKMIRNQQTDLSKETFNYYMSIFDDLKGVEGEAKELLCSNFMKEVLEGGKTQDLVCHRLVSHILDLTLPHSDAESVLKVCDIVIQDVRRMCLDPYASHVMQTLMVLGLKFMQENAVKKEPAVTEEERLRFGAFINKVGRYIYNNLDEFIKDNYASHVFSQLMETLSGVQVKDWIIKSSSRAINSHDFCHDTSQIHRNSAEFQTLFSDIIDRMFMLPDVKGLITENSSSVSLQTTLLVLKFSNNTKCSAFWDHLMKNGIQSVSDEDCEEDEGIPDIPVMFAINAVQRLLEIMMVCATKEELYQMYTSLFQGKMGNLVKYKSTHYSVQKLFLRWKDKDKFHDVFQEGQEILPVAFEHGHFNILQAMSQACLNLGVSQAHCLKLIMQLFGCWESQSLQLLIVPCLMWGLHSDEYKKLHASGSLNKISLPGVYIIQNLLKFNKSIKLVGSIFAMELADLLRMSCDPRGSHVLDAYCSSAFISSKSKEKLIDRLKGNYVILACSNHGSRSLEAMWAVSPVRTKKNICEELVREDLKVKGDKFGFIIWNKFNVKRFQVFKDKKNWEEVIEAEAKKKRELDSLLAEVTEDEPKKKKMKKETDEPQGDDDLGGSAIEQVIPNKPSDKTPTILKKPTKLKEKKKVLKKNEPKKKKMKKETDEPQGDDDLGGSAIEQMIPNKPSDKTPTMLKKPTKLKEKKKVLKKNELKKKKKSKADEPQRDDDLGGSAMEQVIADKTPTTLKKKKKVLKKKEPKKKKMKSKADKPLGDDDLGQSAMEQVIPDKPSDKTPTTLKKPTMLKKKKKVLKKNQPKKKKMKAKADE